MGPGKEEQSKNETGGGNRNRNRGWNRAGDRVRSRNRDMKTEPETEPVTEPEKQPVRLRKSQRPGARYGYIDTERGFDFAAISTAIL